jgi:DNA-binding MarR family transcriptional regulator
MLKFNPTESAGFLVGRVAHALSLHVQEFLDEEGLDVSAEEISILTVVAHLADPKQMKSLAELLGRNATTVSRQVAGLEEQGLLKRSRSTDDGRAFVVSITKSGTKLVQRTIPMTLKLRGRAIHGVSAADAKTLQRVLLQMLANLKDGD